MDFFDLPLLDLEQWFEERGHPRYRARQLYGNVYRRGMTSFEAMTDLPKDLRRDLADTLDLDGLQESRSLRSPADDSLKVEWTLSDGKRIESVFMSAEYRQTICFSTQVGCAFGCSFCITARMGRLRNLTAGEIVGQVQELIRDHKTSERGINLVAMGMGEPMDNLDQLLKAVRILSENYGLNISPRRITVSTVGVVPGIDRLREEAPLLRLALSLNATTDEVRKELMPVTRKWPIDTLIPAVERFAKTTGSRVTLEYVLIRGLNDTPEDADRLGRIASRFPSKVNVIPFNPSELFPYERPTPEEVDAFARRLWDHPTTITVRYSKGVDILAACGQLGYDQVRIG